MTVTDNNGEDGSWYQSRFEAEEGQVLNLKALVETYDLGVGDIVKCVDPSPSSPFTTGRLYTLSKSARGTRLVVENDNGNPQEVININVTKFEVHTPVFPTITFIDPTETPFLNSWKASKQDDLIEQPAHYQMAIQPAEFIDANDLDWRTGDAISYLCRAGKKLYPGMGSEESAILDLRKAINHIEGKIAKLEATKPTF